jgi:nucleotide-binding universal stress UspA family protein
MTEIKTILVPVDFSEHSDKALEYAIGLAKRFGSKLHVLHAYHVPVPIATPDQIAIPRDYFTSIREAAAKRLKACGDKIAAEGLKSETHLTEMLPVTAINETAQQVSADLIVMGTRGLTGLKHVLLGSVAERVIRTAPCPVLALKAHDD